MSQLSIQQAFDLALQLHRSGRLAEAEQLYRQILSHQPQHIDAMHNLAVIEHQAGRDENAIELLRRTLLLSPNHAEAHNNLGNALKDRGQLDEAIAVYRRAATLKPDSADIRCNIGNALAEVGQWDEAIVCFHEAIERDPTLPDVYHALGIALTQERKLDDAIAAYREAISLQPNFPEAHNNLGSALKDNGQLDEAVAAYRHAIALRPEYSAAHSNLGVALADLGRLDEAIAAFRDAVALDPHSTQARSNLVYHIQMHPGIGAQDIFEEASLWNKQLAEPLKKFIRPHSNNRDPERRLRVGYVSADFWDLPVGRFLLPLLAHHDKTKFEVFAYAQLNHADAMTRRLRSCTDAWRGIARLSDGEAADLICGDRIDILVDLAAHTANNRLLVFARRPAPVQVTNMAYPGTTGLEAMDYRITDPYLDPPGTDRNYSEKSIRLPHCFWCFEPPHRSPDVNNLPAARRGAITFGSLNRFCKMTEPVVGAWAHILQQVPNSRLILQSRPGRHRDSIRAVFYAGGIEPDRVDFVDVAPLAEYLSIYGSLDITLDPFPHNGHSSSCDSLWMGVPVVTLAGQTVVGRGGVSLLSNVELPDLIAYTPGQYVDIAVELAKNLARLEGLRSTLRPRLQRSPLMDAPRYARDMEAAYRQMWRAWCETPATKR